MSGKPRWLVTGASVRGASHSRGQRPNQDAVAWRAPRRPADPVVLAVADGHGASRYVRSHRGAKLAVQLATDMLASFAEQHAQATDLAGLAKLAGEQLPRSLVRTWQDRVREDLAARPLNAEEQARWQEQRANRSDPLRAYGATLVTALLTRRYLLFCQLGDGDILIVDSQGGVTRPPLPFDPRLVANQTTSLCGPDAWNDMRVYFQPLTDRPPALVMLASDGYANSFADEAGFFDAATDLLRAFQANGLQHTANRLPHWLHATSAAGSGDDISVVLAFRSSPSQP
ncbi:MAG TPA: PP2C family serine/threonine-protein phosphatase [Caldilineaceae bacterium]|nr:PP2C family serine/threonine-protein phosphatase [Caldilineaceae bacterium]